MNRAFNKFISFPWYPLLFGIYFNLALFSGNIWQAELEVVFRPIVQGFFCKSGQVLSRKIAFMPCPSAALRQAQDASSGRCFQKSNRFGRSATPR